MKTAGLLQTVRCATVAPQMKKLLLIISMTAACLTAQAAISVGAGGSVLFDFTDGNTVTNAGTGWNTLNVPGGGGDATTAAGLAALVNTNSTTIITALLGTSGTTPPSASSLSRRNNTRANVQTLPTGTAYGVLLATLQNDTGSSQSAVTINYTLGDETTGTTTEEIPGHLAFWSLTGAPGSWTEITIPSGGTVGAKSLIANVGTWPSGGTLYILWADDNAAANRDNTGAEEGGYSLDDVQFLPGGTFTETVTVTSPTNTATRPLGAPIVITANATMAGTISGVEFFLDNVSIGTDTTAPYSVTNVGAALGAHQIRATATDNTHSVNSAIVNFTVNPNTLPTGTFIEPPAGTNVLVGTLVNVTATATDLEPGGAVVDVEFYLDGVLQGTDTTSTYTYQYGDSLVGTHTIAAVAVDNSGGRFTNTTTVVVTNPVATILLPNGSTWSYLDDTTDPGATWNQVGFNDSGWSNGVAELGFGDTDVRRPEATVVRRFVGNVTNATYYFRRTVNIPNPASFTGIQLNVQQDDGAIVYVNGNEVYRATNMVGVNGHTSLALSTQPDDGAAYYTTNLSPSLFLAGNNLIAVEVHQNSMTSSDVSFDLMLWGIAPAGTAVHVVQTSPTQAEVSWPDSTPGTAQLYSTTDLNAPVSWSLVGLPVTQSGGFFRVTVSTTGPKKFYTLRQ